MISTNKSRIFYLLFTATFVFISGTINCFAQAEESKSIQSLDFIKNRPPVRPSKGTSGNKPNIKPKKGSYRFVGSLPASQSAKKPPKPGNKPRNSTPKGMEEALLGMTVWKMRPATKNDPAKELVEDQQDGKVQNSEYTLERIASNTPLVIGEKIRLSIESLSHSGYLYVVEREFYSDGTYSFPKLIYPNLLTKNRNNPIGAGDLIFIPEAANRYFLIKSIQAEKKQIAEVLTFVISPQILINQSMLQTKAIDLPPERFANWLEQWEADADLLEQIDGAGQAITLVEQSAGQNSAKGLIEESLTQNDPIPQSIFRTKIKRGNPVLMNVLLELRSN